MHLAPVAHWEAAPVVGTLKVLGIVVLDSHMGPSLPQLQDCMLLFLASHF